MEEILANYEMAKALLKNRKSHSISQSEFKKQCASFVIGNAFDVFATDNVINSNTLNEMAKRRLRIAG